LARVGLILDSVFTLESYLNQKFAFIL